MSISLLSLLFLVISAPLMAGKDHRDQGGYRRSRDVSRDGVPSRRPNSSRRPDAHSGMRYARIGKDYTGRNAQREEEIKGWKSRDFLTGLRLHEAMEGGDSFANIMLLMARARRCLSDENFRLFIEGENVFGQSPMFIAARLGRLDIMKLLKSYGASIPVTPDRKGDGGYLITYAPGIQGNFDVLNWLLDQPEGNQLIAHYNEHRGSLSLWLLSSSPLRRHGFGWEHASAWSLPDLYRLVCKLVNKGDNLMGVGPKGTSFLNLIRDKERRWQDYAGNRSRVMSGAQQDEEFGTYYYRLRELAERASYQRLQDIMARRQREQEAQRVVEPLALDPNATWDDY